MEQNKLDLVKSYVSELLCHDTSGHGMEHINRVVELSYQFALSEEADVTVTTLIALLHDVDDYKLFGKENADNLTNARSIMTTCNIDTDIQQQVLDGIATIGYSKRLLGIVPESIEASCVSDADMCDAMGATGLIRAHAYSISKGRPFFDPSIMPHIDMDYNEYTARTTDSTVNHMFEKIMKLKDLMLTDAGRKEATSRHQFIVDFLYQFFKENNQQQWLEYLTSYQSKS